MMKLSPKKIVIHLLILVGAFPYLVFAQRVNVVFQSIPTSVSGTFRPFSLAVDGKKLFRSPKILKALEINGAKVDPEKNKLWPYFMQRKEERLEIEAHYEDGTKDSWSFELPNLTLEEVTEKNLLFKAEGAAERVLVDGNQVPFKDRVAIWNLPKAKDALVKTRVVEASGGREKPGRLYNLKLIPLPSSDNESINRTLVEPNKTFEPLAFRVSQFSVFQSGGRNSFSGFISWSPSFAISSLFSVGSSFGLSSLKAISGSRFLVWAAEGWVGIREGTVGGELGAGIQNWNGNGGSRLMGSATVHYFFKTPLSGVLDRLFLTYSYFASSPDPSHQLRLGFGLHF